MNRHGRWRVRRHQGLHETLGHRGKRARRPPQGLDELLGQHHVLRHQGHDGLGQQEVHVQGNAALGHQGHPGLVLTWLSLSGLVSGLVWS